MGVESGAQSARAPRQLRAELSDDRLSPDDARAFDAFRRVEYFRPGLQLIVARAAGARPRAGPFADLTLFSTSPSGRAAERAGLQLRDAGWMQLPGSRRTGLWFTGERPAKARDLIAASRRFQALGGTAFGWEFDDPLRDLPNAKAVAPTVSASTFPVKF